MKARLFTLLALVLGMVSCQTEPEGFDVIVGGEVDTTITVTIPESETRADSSSRGVFNNGILDDDNVTMRYILEIWYGGEKRDRMVEFSDDKTVVFPIRLVPDRHYNFVVWADVVTKEETEAEFADADNHYNTADLTAVTYNGTWTAMDETRDAFTGYFNTEEEGRTYTSGLPIDINLIRPFAKLRVITTDFDELAKYGIKATSGKVTYSSEYNRRASFNACIGKASDAITTFLGGSGSYDIVAYTSETNDARTIFSDYIFASTDGDIVKFDLEIYEDGGNRIKANSFNTDICVKRNYITTLKGDVLTTSGNVTVTVKPEFGEEFVQNYVDTVKGLQDAINAAADGVETVIVVGNNIVLTESASNTERKYGFVVPVGKVIVLDLNGKTISQTKAQSGKYSLLENNGTLTIKNGTISYGDSAALTADVGYASNTIQNNGVLTINEGVVIKNTSGESVATYGYPHVIDTNGTLTINGGTLTNEANYSTMRIWTSNTDAEKCNVVINGGTFNGCIDFQAHNNYATMPHYGTLTVNGGTFNADTFTKSAIRVLRFAVNANDMHATVSGGFFNGKVWVRNIGTFAETPKIINIYGGTFTTDAKANSEGALADGYSFVENADGNWEAKSLGYYVDANGNYHITGVNGWLWMVEQADGFFRHKTIYLDNDIDFAGVKVGVTKCYYPEYYATFDGQNHTVSNVWMGYNYSSDCQALFDGHLHIKNLKVDRTEVYGLSAVGIIGAHIAGKIENCHVTNSRAYGYVWQVGGIVGLHSWYDIVDCSVENTRVESYCYGAVGAIAGCMNEVKQNITNCTVKDCKLIREYTSAEYAFYENMYGAFVGCIIVSGEHVFSGTIEDTTIKGSASTQVYGAVYPGVNASVTFNGVQL